MLTLLPEATRQLGVPRAVYSSQKIGSPVGRPHQREEHVDTLKTCLKVVDKLEKGMIYHTSSQTYG